jgi:phenylalanyl-tRNA synthetase beta chain
VRAVELFEVYRGKGVAEGSKSLNFTVTLGAADRTLTDTDEAGYIGAVRAQLGDIGGELRG